MQTKKEKDKLINFYLLIPENYISEAIDSLQFINRDIRRKFSKLKTLTDRFIFIDKHADLRFQFISSLYVHYKDSISFSKNDSFETILSSYNKENCISNTVFLLYRCCQNDDGQFDNKQLLLLLGSKQFNNTINKSWNSVSATVASPIANKNNSSSSLFVEQNRSKSKEKDVMNRYIGYIQKRVSYFNFMPQYRLNGDLIEKIDTETMFPIHGGINLNCYRNYEAEEFLNKKIINNALYVIQFKDEELKDNYDTNGELKSDYQKKIDLSNSQNELEKLIISINELEIYKIVTPVNEITNSDFVDGIIQIKENNVVEEGESVYLKINDKLYGPFTLKERAIDRMKYVQPKLGPSEKYLCKYYDYKHDSFTLKWSNGENYSSITFIEVYHVRGNPNYEDMIPDSILLSKIKDAPNLELIGNNVDEFMRLFENSPYLSSKVDQNFKVARIDRIRNILTDINDFNSEKKEIALELINLVKSNKYLESVIIESDVYNELKKTCVKLQNDNEELKNLVDSLSDKNKQLQNEFENCESNGVEKSQIEITQNEKKCNELKKEIGEYEKKLGAYDDLEKIKTAITEQRGVIKFLELENNDKERTNAELEGRLSDLRNQVKKAIDDGKSDAKLAFDPFISNELLDAAAKWRAKSEDDQYDKTVRNIGIIAKNTPHKDKEILIQHLVEYVQKVRKYSFNDIVNMYICLAQGFLTVFSGEPGTGKTSICNILANSLGLLNVKKRMTVKNMTDIFLFP